MLFTSKVSSIKKVDKPNYSYYILQSANDKVGVCCFAPRDDYLAKLLEEILLDKEGIEKYEFTFRYGAYKKDGGYGRCFRIVDIK